jgi:hypothetical protein
MVVEIEPGSDITDDEFDRWYRNDVSKRRTDVDPGADRSTNSTCKCFRSAMDIEGAYGIN